MTQNSYGCVKNRSFVDRNICKDCTEDCDHVGKLTTRARLEIAEQVRTALESMGVKGRMSTLFPAGYHRYEVGINGEYFGIFDIDRNTFVD